MRVVRIATRGSPLAVAQSRQVGERIEAALGVRAELVTVRTEGDRIQHVPLAAVGGKGLFVKEVEEALLDGRADLAVHSAKDLPAGLAEGLSLAAVPRRADPRDALVGRAAGACLEHLPRGARVGTGSLRRRSQLLALRPDLDVRPLRGNVDTRLRKLEDEDLHAVVLACAGLERLGLADRIHERIAPDAVLPAVAQGTLALEARSGDAVAADLAALDDAATRTCFEAERAFLTRLAGDCNVPLAAYAELDGEALRLRALVASEDGQRIARSELRGAAGDAARLGERAAEEVLEGGGREILATLGLGAAS